MEWKSVALVPFNFLASENQRFCEFNLVKSKSDINYLPHSQILPVTALVAFLGMVPAKHGRKNNA
jgi:hypothetical protein